ncbi:uncharacterized protein LOC134077900 isoform X2 [Sardina pilchardus]|uniref:uncharacterized protein LOC134077900 isoform X2 n=1 Tax=Sardina pilchardus TaxID=27697 RepID=UPI002E15BC33
MLCDKTYNTFLMKKAKWTNDNPQRDMDLHIFAKPITGITSVYLKCQVTGSDLSGVRIQLTKDGVPLDYGVNLIGPLPNGDGTVQMRVQVQLTLRDTEGYQCHVLRSSLKRSAFWDGLSLDSKAVPLSKSSSSVDVMKVVVCVALVACFGAVTFNIHRKSLTRLSHAGGCAISMIEMEIKKYLQYVKTQEKFEQWTREDDEFYTCVTEQQTQVKSATTDRIL